MAGDFDRFFDVPFGFDICEDGTLVENPAEMKVLHRIADCVRAGMTWQQISSILEATDGA